MPLTRIPTGSSGAFQVPLGYSMAKAYAEMLVYEYFR